MNQLYNNIDFLKPDDNLANALFSLQANYFQSENQNFNTIFFNSEYAVEHNVYIIHYSTPYEKNQFLISLISEYIMSNYEQEFAKQILFFNRSHSLRFEYILHKIKQQYTKKDHAKLEEHFLDSVNIFDSLTDEELSLQLHGSQHIISKNNKIKLIIVDSLQHLYPTKYKQDKERSMKEKLIHFEKHLCVTIDQHIEWIRQLNNSIIIVLSEISGIRDVVSFDSIGNQFILNKKVKEIFRYNQRNDTTQVFLLPINLLDPSKSSKLKEMNPQFQQKQIEICFALNNRLICYGQQNGQFIKYFDQPLILQQQNQYQQS